MPYEIYVISNSDLFREGFNAIATFCNSEGFRSTTWIGSAIAIILTIMAYVKQHDVMIYLKWLVVYTFVFNILLGTTSTVAIINTSDQTVPAQVVDNVPFGLALPAHLITAFGYGFSSGIEVVFSMPDEEQYHKTGMLFGSNLFRLSLASQLDDPQIMNDMNNFVRSCVVGDILINKKYTFKDLLNSTDIWALMTSRPSPIRGIFMNGSFKTCIQAASILTKEINTYSSKTAPAILSKFIPSRNPYTPIAINTMLTSSYQYFRASSKTASEILRQNIAINAFRSGLKNYAAEVGSIAGMENMSNTMSMNNTRMAWSSSRHIGTETLPLMQVVLLLLMVCLFPLVVTLTLIPGLGFNVFKNYLYSLLWLETWPIMYAILNMAMNFYLSSGSHSTVTLSNINLLSQEHSDIAGIAGYLILAIPFLSMGIVKGMAFTFNNAAQYLGGMLHSISQGTSASVAMGNYSLGNVSTENATANSLNANKYDTNFTNMQGLSTQQLGNAATVTATSMGGSVYATGHGMSQLATSVSAAENAAASLSTQADQSLRSAMTHSSQYMQSKGQNEALGLSDTSGVSSNVDHAMSTIDTLTNALAKREGITTADAYQKFSKESISFGASASAGFGIGVKVGAQLSGNVSGGASSLHDGNHSTSSNSDISASEARDFREAVNTVKSYSQAHSYSKQNTDAENLAIQTGADISKAEGLSSSAQFIQSHSQAINTNFSQAFANYVQKNYPEEATAILSATGDSPLIARQQSLADQFIQTHAKDLAKQYSLDSFNVHSGMNPMGTTVDRSKYLTQNYQRNTQAVQSSGSLLGIRASQRDDLINSVNKAIAQNQNQVQRGNERQNINRSELKSEINNQIKEGKIYAEKGVTHHVIDKVKNLL